ncbi:MAG: DNA topoisomerase IB [Chloroflexota bacterium]
MEPATALLGSVTVSPEDPAASAQAAGLRYVNDQRPGICRERVRGEFRYVGPEGRVIDDPKDLARIKTLAIPPAWTSVWICPTPRGHIQATARDARGRKQYRYHPRWREVRDETKFERMLTFGQALPAIRVRVEEDVRLPGIPKEKVLATVVRLLEITRIRVGNAEYARRNHHFGLTTMQQKHISVDGTKLQFHFVGKSGKEHTIGVRDRRLARIITRCQELPGHELFQYVDEQGERHSIESDDVNAYLRAISGQEFSAKDFRTWAGTVVAVQALLAFDVAESEGRAKTNVVRAVESVAEWLGNTPTVCRQCYIHPGIIDAYMNGSMAKAMEVLGEEPSGALSQLLPEEAAVLAILLQQAPLPQVGNPFVASV